MSLWVIMLLIMCSALLAFRETRLIGVILSSGLLLLVFGLLGWYFAAVPGASMIHKHDDMASIPLPPGYQIGESYEAPAAVAVSPSLGLSMPAWIKLVLLTIFAAMALGGLLLVILMLSYQKTRPYGIAALVVGPIFLVLIAVGLLFTARQSASQVQSQYYDASWDVQRSATQIRRAAAASPPQARSLQQAYENIVSKYGESTAGFPLSPRLVKNVIFPLPAALPQVPSPEFMQKKIAAMEKTINDMSRVLVNIMTERAKDNIAGKPVAPAVNKTDARLAAAVPGEQIKPAQIRSASTQNAAVNTTSADQSADRAAPLEEAKTYPAPAVQRPDWVGKPPRRVGDSYQMSVCTDPYTNRMECDAKIPEVLQTALDQFIEASQGRPALDWVRLSPEKLNQLIVAEWEEPLQLNIGPMTRVHLLLNFDQKAKELISEAMNINIFTMRAAVAGTVLMGVWMLLAAIWGYLKLDLLSNGAYRGRLRLAAGFAILTIVTMGLLVLRFIA